MAEKSERDLTDLEYAVLGFISFEPQSGYSLISHFEVSMSIRWSASPGSIYPMLKRLEKSGYIAGELDVVHETRPRKMYELTPKGQEVLDAWMRAVPTNQNVAEGRDVMMLKFLFAERRLNWDEVLGWLDRYEAAIDGYEKIFNVNRPRDIEWSTHQMLVVEMSLMEINMQRNWVQIARHRLQVEKLRDDARDTNREAAD